MNDSIMSLHTFKHGGFRSIRVVKSDYWIGDIFKTPRGDREEGQRSIDGIFFRRFGNGEAVDVVGKDAC